MYGSGSNQGHYLSSGDVWVVDTTKEVRMGAKGVSGGQTYQAVTQEQRPDHV